MRSEVQKQIEEIDEALGIITLFQLPNMKVSKEEMNGALQKADSCMRLVINELIKQDKTMKEIYHQKYTGNQSTN